MTFEGIITTPFGYLMDGLYRLTSHYGLSIILFAILVQAVMVPLGIVNRRNAEKKRRLQPMVAKIKSDLKDDPSKQIDALDALYKKEKYSIAGTFILSILPIFILILIFQVMTQPITYLFHETPETAAAIIHAIYDEAPELFVSGYKQVTAITHIAEYADVVKQAVPEVSARTLEGLNYTMLGLDLGAVPGVHILGKSVWAWDWAHIGVVLIPLVYMARRIYRLIAGMIRSYMEYKKAKKYAADNGFMEPRAPRPPLFDMFFLFLSLTALFAVPIAMNLYWLIGGVASSAMTKIAQRKSSIQTDPTTATAMPTTEEVETTR